MISIKRNISASNGLVPRIVIGTAAAIIFAAIVVLIGPIFILNEYLKPNLVHIIVAIAQGVGVLIGALIAGSGIDEGRSMSVSICAAVFYIVHICCGMLFFDSDFGRVATGFLSCATGAACALLLLNRKKKTTKRRRAKRRSR